jgi:flagellar hook-associated protein 1 FlgK
MIEFPGTIVRKPARRRQTAKTGQAARGETAVVAEAFDPLLDAHIQAEASVAGSLAAQQINLQNAGACLHEPVSFSAAPNGLEGMVASLAGLFDSFQNLASDPANFGRRRAVVRSAQKVAAQFNQAASRLTGLENDLNASIQKDAILANRNLADIAGLNWLIMEALASGGTSGLLAGRRAQSLETLSGCVSIDAAPATDGSVKVDIGGVTMVRGAATPDSLATHPDQNGNLRVRAQNAGTPLTVDGGSIAGKIAARDGGLAGLQRGLNLLAAQLITLVNTIYNSGHDLDGGTGRNFFTGACASDIGVNAAVADDPSRLQAAAAPGAHGNNTVAQSLAKLGSRNVSDLGNQTFVESYAQTVSKLGHTLSGINDDLMSSQVVTQMLANERGQAHDVSLDDEKADLRRYRQAYAVSVKMMTALNEMTPVE